MLKPQLSWQPYSLQLKYPFTISSNTRSSTPVVLTELRYGEWVGYGEASLPPYLGETQESVVAFLKQVDLSRFSDLSDIDTVLAYVDGIAAGNTAAKASVDIALHDLVGKMQGQAWYQIWGLNPHNTPNSTYTIGIDSDEVVRKKTAEVAADFKILKVKLGATDDKRMIEVIRSVTDVPLAVDANQGWKDKTQALEMVYWLKEQGVVLIEQPMLKNDLEGSAWLTAHSPLPIFADESVQRLADLQHLRGAFSGINIKLMKCTGMNEARQMIALAPTLGFDVMLGCMTETSCAISAASQLSPAVSFADLDGSLLITNDCFAGTSIKNGKISLTNLPGIGVVKI